MFSVDRQRHRDLHHEVCVRARKVDSNLTEIVEALRKLGIKILVWNDHADLIAQFGGMTALIEVRPDGQRKQARKGRQEAFQRDFMVFWASDTYDCEHIAKTLKSWQRAVSGLKAIPDVPVEG